MQKISDRIKRLVAIIEIRIQKRFQKHDFCKLHVAIALDILLQ